MPVQRTLLGRPILIRMPPRRFLTLIGLTFILLVLLYVSLASSVPILGVSTVEQLSEKAQHAADIIARPNLPKLYNPFGTTAHVPPEQINSTHGDTRWYSDWKWLHPFSSHVTLDEDRAVLPPLALRTPIYTFYDVNSKKDARVRDAENELLLVWRRAWWAQGFKPVVLGRAEAMAHPLYRTLQELKLDPALEQDFEKWLAWEQMSGGILANWLALPMAEQDHSTLSYLRRGVFPKLTRYRNLASGLFVGMQGDIGAALGETLKVQNIDKLKKSSNIVDALAEVVEVDSQQEAIAYYDITTIKANYKTVDESLAKSLAEGYRLLRQLINSHLQNTWQNIFSDGVAVLKPPSQRMTALLSPAVELARSLRGCPETPMPAACPPNRPTCKPCDETNLIRINTPETFENRSGVFTIGLVPHPYTFLALDQAKDVFTAAFVRRNTTRDPWLKGTTRSILGNDLSGPQRLVHFKEAVASERGASTTLWLPAEQQTLEDLEWKFGFALQATHPGVSEPATRLPLLRENDPAPSEADLAQERTLLDGVQKVLTSTRGAKKMDKEMIEAWNMADVEAWRFAKAFEARRVMEREKLEEDERAFAGAERPGGRFGKWFDR